MAIKSTEDIRPEALFGRRLFQLGADINMNGPASVAEGLYLNEECYKLVKPRGRDKKYQVNRSQDIAAISRTVQRHFDYEEATDVPGNYMMAYSVLFDCSLDYLYGKIDVKSPNAEVLDISKKTGLSVEAVKKLMQNDEICIEEYLQAVNNYGLLDGSDAGTYDPELDDCFFNTYASITDFWSKLIESEVFKQLPEDWYRMACALYTIKSIKLVAKEAENDLADIPSLENFLSWIDTWENFHPNEPLHRPYNMSWEEAYKKDPALIKQVYKELRHEHFYSAIEKIEEYETVYWGCAGRFERAVLNFFHQKAEQWCTNGPLPAYFFDSDE